MKESAKRKRLVDIAMAVLLPLLMAYVMIGEVFHEAAGTLMFVLMVLHIAGNRRFIAAIPRGRYTPGRTLQTVIDVLLMVFMVLQPITGILMSKHLYPFVRIPGISSRVREVHMFLAYWGFVLMSVHAGTHLLPMVRKLRAKPPAVRRLLAILAVLTCGYGAYAFVKRGIPGYMFRRTMFAFFDTGESTILFLLDYLAVMVLFAALGLGLKALTASLERRKKN